MGTEEERCAFPRRLDLRVDVAERILFGLETKTAQIADDDVRGGLLLARRRRQRGKLEKEIHGIGHGPILWSRG